MSENISASKVRFPQARAAAIASFSAASAALGSFSASARRSRDQERDNNVANLDRL